MSDLLELVSLQFLDDELDGLRARLQSVEQRLGDREALDAAAARKAAAESAVAELARRQRQADAAIEDLDARIGREEKKLYDGSVRQFKELQALEGEIAHLRRDRSALEDAGLALLAEVDAANAELAAAAAELANQQAEWEARAAAFEAEAEQLKAQIQRAEALRKAQLERITAGSVRLYEALRRRKAGKAVVRVQGGSCSGCRVAIPEPIRRRIASSPTLVQCPHCERILAVA